MQPDQRKKTMAEVDFFTEYGEGSRYKIEEVIGKGSYGVVCSALEKTQIVMNAVDHFKKQFAYLEEHYVNGATAPPPERQHASLPRQCVLYSNNVVNNSAIEAAGDLSNCSIEEIENPRVDRNSGFPMTRLPLQVPPSIQGGVARPGKVVSSVMRYSNCGSTAATGEALEQQRRVVKNPAASAQYTNATGCLYPRGSASSKNERVGESEKGVEPPNGLQQQQRKPNYMARKMAAAAATGQGGTGNQWY